MYNILLMISKRDDNKSLYRYYCVDKDGIKMPYTTSSIEELKETVENLLWTHNKEEILVIQEVKCDVVVNMNEK